MTAATRRVALTLRDSAIGRTTVTGALGDYGNDETGDLLKQQANLQRTALFAGWQLEGKNSIATRVDHTVARPQAPPDTFTSWLGQQLAGTVGRQADGMNKAPSLGHASDAVSDRPRASGVRSRPPPRGSGASDPG